jgi:tetratricopeptide (TPR) repeat protein
MSRIISFLFISVILIACGSEETQQDIYDQPPYASLTDSIEQFPKNAELYYKRGVLFYNNQDADRAAKDIQHAWELNASEQYALSMVTILREKHADSAIAFIQQALQKIPNSLALQVGLARGYQAKGDTEKALQITDNIIQQYPGQIDALTIQSELLKNKDANLALSKLETAHSLVPSDPQLAYDLAFEYAEVKNEKAVKLTDSLIKAKAPEIEKAFYLRGLYYANTGNTTKAIENYDESIRKNYNFLDAYRDKGQLLFNQKNYTAARKTFELALRVEPEEPEFYYWLAKIDKAEGKKAEAKLNYKRAYELDKSFTEAKQAYDRL